MVTLRESKSTTPSMSQGRWAMTRGGNIAGPRNMEVQMRQAYANIEKLLAQYGATIDNIVDEVLFVTDMDAAFAARSKCKQEVFSGNAVLASTIVQIQRLAFPELMVEIRCICRV
jgi:2-iminobutanoate/2-iminopropanoate deaminase